MDKPIGKNIENSKRLIDEITESNDEELRASKLRFDLAIKGSNDGIWDWDIENDKVWWSPRIYELLGYKEGEIEGSYKSFLKLLHLNSKTEVLNAIKNHLEDRKPYDIECQLLTKFGDYRWFRIHGQAIWDENGKAIHMAGFLQDITERKEVETALHDSEEKYRSLVNTMNIGLGIVDEHGCFTFVNDKDCEIYGYSREELIGSRVTDYLDEESLEVVLDQLERRKRGEYAPYEVTLIRKNGEKVNVIVSPAPPIYNSEGVFKGSSATVIDITEQKKAENKYRRVNEQLNAIIESVPECVKTIAKDGTVLSMNPAGLDMVEAESFAEVDGASLYRLIAPEHRDSVKELNKRIFNGDSAELEYELIGLKEGRKWLSTHATPLRDESGNITSHLGVTRDITERKETESDLFQMNLALSNAMPGISRLDADGHYLYVNDIYAEMLGYSPDELLGVSWEQTVHDDDKMNAVTAVQQTIDEGKGEFEARAIRKDGSEFFKQVLMVRITDKAGQIVGHHCFMKDISERKQAEEELKKLSRAVEASSSSVIITNIHDHIEYVNPKFTEITGYTREDVLGKNPNFMNSGQTPQHVIDDLLKTISSGREWRGELHNRKKDGSSYWARVSVSCVKDTRGEITHFVGILDDMTHEYEMVEQLSYQASYDALTGLINRREFERRAERLLSTVKQGNDMHALCYLDLDQFKLVNDTCGHTAGDEMLRQLGFILQSKVRQRDTLARLGGDEFGVLMEHCSLDQANRVATSLQDAVQDFQFAWEEHTFRVGVSMGLVAITEAVPSLTELLKQADAACYMAKDLGRNRIHVYNGEDASLAQRHGEMQWVARIHRALEEDRFCLYAQTIVPLDSRYDKHYELLIRMVDEQGKIIPPGAFLPAAERYHLMTKLDYWVIERAFTLLAEHPVFLKQIEFISINISGHSLAENTFQKFVAEQLQGNEIPPEKICFEITETAAISNLSTANVFIAKMSALGCKFALDDFGSGLSSFAYLKKLPVDYLKIDGMFVRDIINGPIDHAMVKSINQIGQVMGMQTIAEFVENDEIKGMLREIGVNYAQGYGVGMPVAFDEILNRSKNVTDINNLKGDEYAI